jgi:hypothetical protein
MKNEVFGENYVYTCNNSFECPGMPAGIYSTLTFELKDSGAVQLTTKAKYGADNYPTQVFLKDR